MRLVTRYSLANIKTHISPLDLIWKIKFVEKYNLYLDGLNYWFGFLRYYRLKSNMLNFACLLRSVYLTNKTLFHAHHNTLSGHQRYFAGHTVCADRNTGVHHLWEIRGPRFRNIPDVIHTGIWYGLRKGDEQTSGEL